MPRPRLEVGELGEVAYLQLAHRKVRARGRFRDAAGRVKYAQATGTSQAAARRALEAVVRERTGDVGQDVTGATTVDQLAVEWVRELEQSKLRARTVAEYRALVDRAVLPALGGLALREVTVGRVQRFLAALAESTPAKARNTKVVLSEMFALAVRHDALQHNPVAGTRLPHADRKPPKALSPDEYRALRANVAAWQAAPADTGRPRTPDLVDVLDVLAGTGLRIGELCALRWFDVDLDGERPTLTVAGTVTQVSGQGLVRQPVPKTDAGHRTVMLPRFVVAVLLRRSVNVQEGDGSGLVFPSAALTLRSPHNLRRQLRDARGDGFEWVTPHTLRRSAATAIDRAMGTDPAAAQLGHASPAVTGLHYVERAALAPDLTAVLEGFAGGTANESGDIAGT
ncbi:tyrosine-type recombinase/integrase [Kocuria aegyptia]|uniref:Tyrosine-type recombinase/integrase n=2 Tax=Kocuria aegyptia TaxID=330943 RepID=A0ABP4XD19_9MICC